MADDDLTYDDDEWTPAFEDGTVCVVLEDMDDILMPGSIVKILKADTDEPNRPMDGLYEVEELFVRPGSNYSTSDNRDVWGHKFVRFFESELQPVQDAFCDTVTNGALFGW